MSDPKILDYSTKGSVAHSFGRSADYYEKNAVMQKEIAARLIAALEPWQSTLPDGPILEVGSGTGFVTEGLLDLFPNRRLEITDISEGMVDFCREKFGDRENLRFYPMDCELLDVSSPRFAMTISGFAAQWFRHPAIVLGRCLEATLPGGLLLASFPGSESFPEWKECCAELGLPYTGNDLPDTEEMVIKLSGGPVQVDFYEDTVVRRFDDAADFFHHIKNLGAGVTKKGRTLAPKQMRMLIKHWNNKADGEVTVSFHIVFLAVKRNYNS